jgi:DNA mismatch repair protein MSH6
VVVKEMAGELGELDRANVFDEKRSIGYDDFDERTPEWARTGVSRDKQKRLHGTSEADPTTLFIPEGEFKKLTSSMQQYWQIKSENFDKVIFFKLGKFYELFFEDAMVGHRHLDLNFMGRKMHAGFPEKAVNKYAK